MHLQWTARFKTLHRSLTVLMFFAIHKEAKQMADERSFSQPGIYHIRVRGSLNSKWADWFPGFVMMAREGGETLLSGSMVDQAALHGVLAKIHSLGLPLILVAWIECPCSSKDCPRHGVCQECASHHTAIGDLPYCFTAKTRWDNQCRSLTMFDS